MSTVDKIHEAVNVIDMVEQMAQQGKIIEDASDDAKIAGLHHFNHGIFKTIDFVVFRVLKHVVKVVHFVCLFVFAFVTDFFKFVDTDLGIGLGLFINDTVFQVINLVVSILSMVIMRADIENLIPRSNYFDGVSRITDLKDIDMKTDELVTQWYYGNKH